MIIGYDDVVQLQGGDLVLGYEYINNPEYQHPSYLPLERVYYYGSREWCAVYSRLTGEAQEYDPRQDSSNHEKIHE